MCNNLKDVSYGTSLTDIQGHIIVKDCLEKEVLLKTDKQVKHFL